jgi:hypothetical protein
MLLTVIVGLWMLLLVARGTPIGDWLQRWMVAKPASALSRIRRDTVITLLLLVALGAGIFWVMGHEGVQLYSMALPELTGMLAALDVTALVDAAIALAAAGSVAGWSNLRAALTHRLRRPHANRARRTRRPGKPAANDDGDGPALALAA